MVRALQESWVEAAMGSPLPQGQLRRDGLSRISERTACLTAAGLCTVNLPHPGGWLHRRARSSSQPEAGLSFNKLFRQNSMTA